MEDDRIICRNYGMLGAIQTGDAEESSDGRHVRSASRLS